jgi:aspartate aminotransferase
MNVLDDAGIEYAVPEGAFYMFCKAPAPSVNLTTNHTNHTNSADKTEVFDDMAFCDHLKKYLVLCAPGTSFGGAGWFRMAYCVSEKTIENSREPLKKAVKAW